MSLEVNTYTINHGYSANSQVIDSSGVNWAYARNFSLSNSFKWSSTNAVNTAAGGIGDNIICPGGIRIDGDLVITAGYTDGFAIRRIENDGSISLIYSEATPDSYANWTSCALDKVNHQAYIGIYARDAIVQYDYRDVVTGGSTVDSSVWRVANGFTQTQSGNSYTCGLDICGDYLYIGGYAGTSYQIRRNLATQAMDNIDVSSYVAAGYRGRMIYEPSTNRMWNLCAYNGDFWVTINPDNSTGHPTAPAWTVNTRISTTLFYGLNDIYAGGIVQDPNNDDYLWFMSNYGAIIKADIGPVLRGESASPTLIQRSDDWYYPLLNVNPVPSADGYHGMNPHPVYGSDMIIINSDRGFYNYYGWVDKENCQVVGINYYSNSYWDKGGTHRYPVSNGMQTSYGPVPLLVTTADSSQYLVYSGYAGTDGYRFRTWDIDMFELCQSSYIIWGDFSLASNKNIGAVQLKQFNEMVYVLSGTTFTCEVSNDSGATWESYDYEGESLHQFNSTGNVCRVKVTMTGDGKKCSYMLGSTYPNVTIYGVTGLFNKNYTNVSSKKIKGV